MKPDLEDTKFEREMSDLDNNSQHPHGFDDGYDDLGGGNFDDFGGSGSTMEKHSDLLKNLTDFDPYLQDLVNHWLGLRWDEDKKIFVRDPLLSPLMNVRGTMWCVGLLKTYTRKNNIITNISKREYINLIKDLLKTIWINLGARMEEFEIKSNGDLIAIATQIQHSAELILMGAGDGKYNQLLQTTVSRSESVNMSPNSQQPQIYDVRASQKSPGLLQKMRKAFGG